MEFIIENAPVFTTLKVKLQSGESIRAKAGAMASMSHNIDIQAKSAGKGIMGALKAAVGGESFFASQITAKDGSGEVILAPAQLGDIVRIELRGNTVYAQGGSYLAGTTDLEISTKGSLKGMITGEGLFLQKISGHGTAFINSYGAIIEKNLAPGEKYVIDTAHLVAFEESVQYSVRRVSKSIFSTLASGEGLVAEYTGPGKVWMQTRNLPAFAGILEKMLPNR